MLRTALRSGPRAGLPANLKIHKNGIYYARFYIPERFKSRFGCFEVVRSLYTANRREAEYLLFELKLHFLKILQMSELHPELSGPVLIGKARRYLERVQEIARSDFLKTATRPFQIAGYASTDDLMAEEADDFIQRRQIDLRNRNLATAGSAVDEILAVERVAQSISPAARNTLAHYTMRAQIEAARLTADLFRGRSEPFDSREPVDGLFKQPSLPPASDSTASGMPFGPLVGRFLEEETVGLKPKTVIKYRWQLKVAVEFFGSETKAESISRRRVTQYRDLLRKLPANFSKRFKGKSLLEIAELPETDRRPLLKPSAINPYLTSLGQLFEYGEGIGETSQNPASRMQVKDPVKAKDKRLPFSVDQLRQLFSQPLYVGHNGCHWAKSGKTINRDIRYWVPLIGLFTGMRLGEICDLTPECLIVEDRAMAFDVRDAKTNNGIRKVPLPSQLKALGITDFFSRVEKGKSIAGDSSKDSLTKFFTRFLRSSGVDTDRRSFHSFRHTFIDAARTARIPPGHLKAIVGHAGGTTTDNYGSALPLSFLHAEMEKLDFWGLDLAHLFETLTASFPAWIEGYRHGTRILHLGNERGAFRPKFHGHPNQRKGRLKYLLKGMSHRDAVNIAGERRPLAELLGIEDRGAQGTITCKRMATSHYLGRINRRQLGFQEIVEPVTASRVLALPVRTAYRPGVPVLPRNVEPLGLSECLSQ